MSRDSTIRKLTGKNAILTRAKTALEKRVEFLLEELDAALVIIYGDKADKALDILKDKMGE